MYSIFFFYNLEQKILKVVQNIHIGRYGKQRKKRLPIGHNDEVNSCSNQKQRKVSIFNDALAALSRDTE